VLAELEVVNDLAVSARIGVDVETILASRCVLAARNDLRIRRIARVDGDDAGARTQGRDVVRLSVRRPLASMTDIAGERLCRLERWVLAVRTDVIDGYSVLAHFDGGQKLPLRIHLQRLPRVEHRIRGKPRCRCRTRLIGNVEGDRARVRRGGCPALVEICAVLPCSQLPARAFTLVLTDDIDVAV